jgi:hypothetical protein
MIEAMSKTQVGVWDYARQKFIEFVPCPGEKRVRIDVYDSLDNYGVFAGTYQGRTFVPTDGKQLSDWQIDLT